MIEFLADDGGKMSGLDCKSCRCIIEYSLGVYDSEITDIMQENLLNDTRLLASVKDEILY